MTGCGPRSFVLLLIAGAAGCGPGGGKGGRIDPASIEVVVGTGGAVEAGRWTGVRVGARTAAGVFDGEVEIAGIRKEGSRCPERFRKRFATGREVQKTEVPVRVGEWARIAVTFRAGGAEHTAYTPVTLATRDAGFRLLVVGGALRGASTIAGTIDASRSDAWNQDHLIDAAGLPRHFLGFDPMDLVVLDAPAAADLDPERLEPLAEWTRRGGTVAAVAGREWDKAPPAVLDLFGLRAPPRTVEGPAGREPAEGAPATFALDPAAGTRLLEHGLLGERPVGSGRAFVLARPPAAVPAGGADAAAAPGPTAWTAILAAARESRRLREALDFLEYRALEAIASKSGLQYPSRKESAIFVIAYAAVAIVIAGLVFSRLRRLEGMYAVAVLLAVAASIAIWRYGLVSGIQEFGVDAITVARLRPGTSIADTTTWVGISSPVRRTLRPEATEESAGLVPTQPSSDYRALLESLPRARAETWKMPLDFLADGSTVRIPEIDLLPNATRFLRFDGRMDLAGKIEVKAPGGDDAWPAIAWIEGGASRPLHTAYVRVDRLDELEFDFDADSGGPPVLHPLRETLSLLVPGRRALVAALDVPLFPAAVLGPVRRSITYIVVEVSPP